MKYYLIVGEASGDLHASNLMRALKEQDGQAEFRFFGGISHIQKKRNPLLVDCAFILLSIISRRCICEFFREDLLFRRKR